MQHKSKCKALKTGFHGSCDCGAYEKVKSDSESEFRDDRIVEFKIQVNSFTTEVFNEHIIPAVNLLLRKLELPNQHKENPSKNCPGLLISDESTIVSWDYRVGDETDLEDFNTLKSIRQHYVHTIDCLEKMLLSIKKRVDIVVSDSEIVITKDEKESKPQNLDKEFLQKLRDDPSIRRLKLIPITLPYLYLLGDDPSIRRLKPLLGIAENAIHSADEVNKLDNETVKKADFEH